MAKRKCKNGQRKDGKCRKTPKGKRCHMVRVKGHARKVCSKRRR